MESRIDRRVEILGEYYPIEDLLVQNDIEPRVVIAWLHEEGFIDLDDYFYDNEELIDDGS